MQTHSHGNLRGFDRAARSHTFEGRFGRMFRNLEPARFEVADLEKLSEKMISRAEAGHGNPDPPDSNIPAGYTFFGQFLAHDITFDPASSLERENDPDALVDYRTPRFDLDSVYGRGPADQPYLYEDDVHLLLGDQLDNKEDWDVPRVGSTGRAIIGDPRNDENVIIAQLHAIFLRLHNRVVDGALDGRRLDFATAQREVRWRYQWVILHDFLQRIVNKTTYDEVLPHVEKLSNIVEHSPDLRFYKPRENAFMPVEFSAAAYRFGHSTIREKYRVNQNENQIFFMFSDDPTDDLRGCRRFNKSWFIDWSLFFEGIPATSQRCQLQRAHRIGTSIVQSLATLPPVVSQKPSLPMLNLIRGWKMGLPSGQAVSDALGQPLIPEKELTVGTRGQKDFGSLDKISPSFSRNAPLWYYILAEAEMYGGDQLGPVGGRIVMETFVGLLMEDGHSYLRQAPLWKPVKDLKKEKFGITELMRMAIGK